MTLKEFDEALLEWGGDLDRWPPVERASGRALLGTDAAARSLLEEMASFETDLGAAMSVDVDAGAVSARVQAAIHDRRENAGLLSLLPLKKILGFGSLAGVGGAVAALALPASVNSSALLAMALSGGAY
jgi:hypothetical protein